MRAKLEAIQGVHHRALAVEVGADRFMQCEVALARA